MPAVSLRDHRAVRQYLARHACAEAGVAALLGSRRYRHAVAVPAIAEDVALLDDLAPAAADAAGPIVCVLVVNATDAAPPATLARNDALIAAAIARASRHSELRPGAWLLELDAFDVVLLDRTSVGRRLPPRTGVGLARRIGCDVALALAAAGRLDTAWIHMTDGDAIAPADYFRAADAAGADAVALVRPFWHEAAPSPGQTRALELYELSLRYYVLGLAAAGSPYAFHMMGSAIAVRADAYAAVRGVPDREAAEDFYLLNKLAKVGRVISPDVAPIRLHGRGSDRVPFGTGAAMTRIAGQLDGGGAFCLYAPAVFAELGAWLDALAACARAGDGAPCRALVQAPAHRALAAAVDELGLLAGVDRAVAAATTAEARARRLRTWFDAFRTLKLVHGLRDHGLANVPWAEAIQTAPFTTALGDLARAGDVTELRRATWRLEPKQRLTFAAAAHR